MSSSLFSDGDKKSVNDDEEIANKRKFSTEVKVLTIQSSELTHVKTFQDPLSHRVIEKRRRDRMNNCLADLSRLIPTAYLKKGRGRVEKTEIVETAIRHLRHLQRHAPCRQLAELCDAADDRDEGFRIGYQECLSEMSHALVEVVGLFSEDDLCVSLRKHLKRHLEEISAGKRQTPVDLRKIPLSHTEQPENLSTKRLGKYKFKADLRERFGASASSPEPSTSSSTTTTTTCCGANDNDVPAFALHPSGVFYVPLFLKEAAVSPQMSAASSSSPSLHPVTISVSFVNNNNNRNGDDGKKWREKLDLILVNGNGKCERKA